MKKAITPCGLIILAFVILCLASAGVVAIYNQRLFAAPASKDSLNYLDIARLEEAIQLRKTFGEDIWPEYKDSTIPLITWNRQYAYLVGHPSPPEDWREIPDILVWGQPVYRHDSYDHQNFAVRIDGVWTASMASKQETDYFLIEVFHKQLPPLIKEIFPYFLLIQPSEVQISAVLHETFHVFQAQKAPGKLELAENAHKSGNLYWAADRAMHNAWAQEIDLLSEAIEADTIENAMRLSAQFLEQRRFRRQEFDLDAELVDYEKLLEWEEGLAKYVELASWKAAFQASNGLPAYQPTKGLGNDADFKQYKTFPRRWSQEIGQMKRQAKQEGETRFYYTGMAQAFLLDRLMPGWKLQAFDPGITLEDLLEKAIQD